MDQPPVDRPATPLDPAQIGVWRTGAAISAFVIFIAAAAATAPAEVAPWVRAAGLGLIALVGAFYTLSNPRRRWQAWRYDLIGDELLVERGVLTSVRTVVPLARVQHIDVAQGPLERRAGLGRLIVHTAGTGSSDVAIPGLRLADAEALRDRIRAFIRHDTP